jgi:hypothetical protein
MLTAMIVPANAEATTNVNASIPSPHRSNVHCYNF